MMANLEESLEKQKKTLITFIKEAGKKEKDRLKRLTNVKTGSEQQALLERFTRERQIDQMRTEQLMNDFNVLQTKFSSGELDAVREERLHSDRKKEVIEELLPNRFAGIEDRNGQIFFAAVVKKFDNHDKTFERQRTRQPFDMLAESKRLKLLTQKRDLLTKLINIQHQENRANNVISPFSTSSYPRSYDTQSQYSSVSSGSYATFATNPVRQNQTRSGRSLPPVPKLKLPNS